MKQIYTVGHSTRSIEEFLDILKSFEIQLLVDIRTFPGSRRYPHFNKEQLEVSLQQAGIGYLHMKELGGRRKPHADSINTGWRNEGFRGYADYMESEEFKNAIVQLEALAAARHVVYMCSEALWWRCHRSLVSDYLKLRGWKVMHLISTTKSEEHRYTSPAQIVEGKLSYCALL